MEKGRKQKAVINILAYISYFTLTTIVGFVSRKIFLDNLGSEILGLTELLTSVISMLSLVELGFGSAIYYSLYKPLAEDSHAEIKGIMRFYKKAYYIIGFVVLVFGLFLVPFLPYIAGETVVNHHLYMIYAIFLVDTVLSYYLSYRRTIICADQKEYIATFADALCYIFTVFLQIFIVIKTKNIYAYLVIKVIFVVLRNVYLYVYAGKKYSYLNDCSEEKFSDETKQELINNVKAIFLGNIGAYLITGTDNLYLSLFADLSAVYIYSNYKMIMGMVNGIFNQIFAYAKANIGNYIVLHTKEETYQLFKRFFFLNYLLTQYTSITMFVVFNSFIELWLGKEYCWPIIVVFLILLKNYGSMMNQALEAFRAAAGLFAPKKVYRYIALMEGGLNIIFSLAFIVICDMGIIGVFLGTVVSNIVSVYIVPFMTYTYLFNKNVRLYFKVYFQYLGNSLAFAFICLFAMKLFSRYSLILQFIIGIFICFIIPVLGNLLLYHRKEEFKYWMNVLKKVMLRNRKII